MKKIFLLPLVFAVEMSIAQETSFVGKLRIGNDGVYNTTFDSGGVSRMQMGFDGATGYVKFGAHTGTGQREDILYMRGSDGNIGVGTNNPKNKLQIGEYNNGGITKVSIPGVYNFEEIRLGQYGNGQNGLEMITHKDQNQSFGVRLFSGTDTGVNGLLIQTADPKISLETLAYTTKMVVDLSGKVGIGVLNPSNKLDVNGTIHSKEVKVDMTGWSDFVFKKEYNLPTLEEVEKHIAEKGHLQNIPSEEEVLKNGISLGDMNAKLLQKIEELTLYAIEQNKITSKQSDEINDLKDQLIALKQQNEAFKAFLERQSQIEYKLK